MTKPLKAPRVLLQPAGNARAAFDPHTISTCKRCAASECAGTARAPGLSARLRDCISLDHGQNFADLIDYSREVT